MKNVDSILKTLERFDPQKVTILYGRAAQNLHLEEARIPYEPTGDVDSMCPQYYFDELISTIPQIPGIAHFRMRSWRRNRPDGSLAVHNTIDLFPAQSLQALGYLAFTARQAFGGAFWTSYNVLNNSTEEVVTAAYGVRCLTLFETLRWQALVGRPKDIPRLRRILPIVIERGLISSEQTETITSIRKGLLKE